MARMRRVAVAINLGYALRHHQDIYAGIHRFALAHPAWQYVNDPFLGLNERYAGMPPYDGIIGRATSELAALAAQAQVPLVNVWSGSPAKDIPGVWADYRACGQMAAEHLLIRGYRRFAFHGLVRHHGTRLALDGFQAALGAARCHCAVQTVSTRCDEDAFSWERFLDRLQRWMGLWKPPVGVFVVQDFHCRYLANACAHAGLRVPEDVALIGIGDEPLVCTRPEPSLSSVDPDFERVGYEAAVLLDRLMDGKPAPAAPLLIAPKGLVLRRSTDLWLVGDPMVAEALRFIAEHSHEGIRVTDVARHINAAVRSLERNFRAVLGRTIKEEINRLRLDRAKRLLVETTEPIKYVARTCGFASATYYHQVFMQAEGLTPIAYRRRHGGK